LPSEEDEEIIELVEEVAEEQDRAAAEQEEIAPPGLPELDLSGLDEEDKAPDAEEIELLEVDEGAAENDRLWLEELERELLPPDSLTNDDPSKTAAPAAPPLEPGPETTAADIFAAHLEAQAEAPEPDEGPAAALAAQPIPPAAPAVPLAPPAPALSEEAVEAVVERVLARKLGTDIPTAVRRAIEESVAREIERVKRLILEEDLDAEA
jgi:hypothetical protein